MLTWIKSLNATKLFGQGLQIVGALAIVLFLVWAIYVVWMRAFRGEWAAECLQNPTCVGQVLAQRVGPPAK